MKHERIACFVDGFNPYHALRELRKPHLKWLNLALLMRRLFPHQQSQHITAIFFFSAYPTWKKDSYERHRKYVAALQTTCVQPILGQFKIKHRKCPSCSYGWEGHEEKESDVNIALVLLDQAYKNGYDHAVIISRDSDLAPAIRMIRNNFPKKIVTIISPFNISSENGLSGKSPFRYFLFKTCKITLVQKFA